MAIYNQGIIYEYCQILNTRLTHAKIDKIEITQTETNLYLKYHIENLFLYDISNTNSFLFVQFNFIDIHMQNLKLLIFS